jgi:hypothetical protein
VLAGEPFRVGDDRVVLSDHAIGRYLERCSRFDTLEDAGRELAVLIQRFGKLGPVPEWLGANRGGAEQCLCIGLNIVLPVQWRKGVWVAVTCVSQGWVRRTRRETARKARAGKSTTNEGNRT